MAHSGKGGVKEPSAYLKREERWKIVSMKIYEFDIVFYCIGKQEMNSLFHLNTDCTL